MSTTCSSGCVGTQCLAVRCCVREEHVDQCAAVDSRQRRQVDRSWYYQGTSSRAGKDPTAARQQQNQRRSRQPPVLALLACSSMKSLSCSPAKGPFCCHNNKIFNELLGRCELLAYIGTAHNQINASAEVKTYSSAPHIQEHFVAQHHVGSYRRSCYGGRRWCIWTLCWREWSVTSATSVPRLLTWYRRSCFVGGGLPPDAFERFVKYLVANDDGSAQPKCALPDAQGTGLGPSAKLRVKISLYATAS